MPDDDTAPGFPPDTIVATLASDGDVLIYSEEARAKIASDPELAALMRDLAAQMRQAHWAWQQGHYASFEDAMEAITGTRPTEIDADALDDDDDEE